MKKSEARILTYLSQVSNENKYATKISAKLEIDYNYLLRILASMVTKGWLKRIESQRKVSYEITNKAPLDKARTTISSLVVKMKEELKL